MKTSEQRLRKVFEMVLTSTNWKMPIDATIVAWDATIDELREAVIYYTGSVPKIEPAEVLVRHSEGLVTFTAPALHVTAAGYYATIGA